MNLISRTVRNLSILCMLGMLTLPLFARPAARANPVLVWDEAKERIVLFGGETRRDSSSLRYYLNDTWEWNGKLWVQVYPENPPPGRAGQAMVYDSTRNRIVIFGGQLGPDSEDRALTLLRNDTWELANNRWRQLTSPTSPPARQRPGFAYDVRNDRTVMYGGYDASNSAIYDTWLLEGNSWRKLNTTAQVNNPIMVHDPVRRQTLMLGSDPDGATVMYEFANDAWRQLTPENLPECVLFGAMTFEQRFTRVAFQGGACFNAPTVAETWLWHGDDWAKLEPVPTPGRVTGFGFANDPIRQESIMFGGVDFQERSYTYAFKDNNWAFQFENQVPGGRSLFAFAADPERKVSWLFGGLDDVGDLLNDLFMLRGGVWSRVNREGGPPFCFNPLGAYDKGRERFVLICDNGTVFEWDGDQWYDHSETDPQPGDRRFAAATYDERLGKVVYYGGFDEFNYLTEAWLWDGSKWTEVENKVKESPPARGLPAMFYDPYTERTIVYGGIGRPTIEDAIKRYEDMWSFDGTKWTELKPTTNPGPLYGPQVGWDPSIEKTVVFGGKNGKEKYVNQQWSWDGSNWAEITTQNPPSPRMNGAMAIDPISGKLTLYGGYAGYYFSELWSVENGVWTVHPYKSSRGNRPVRPGSNDGPGGEASPEGPED